MQNHYVISSKYHFWTRNVLNSTKSSDLVMSGPVQEDPYGPHMGPYGPTWAHKGPYGPIWAHMGPYGPQPGPGPNPDWAPSCNVETYVETFLRMLWKTLIAIYSYE